MILNKVFKIEDLDDADYKQVMHQMYGSNLVKANRKNFEYYILLKGCEQFNLLNRNVTMLSVAAGIEQVSFYLTTFAKEVIMTDLYGDDAHACEKHISGMLVNPSQYAIVPIESDRLTTKYMNALSLNYDDNTFDLTYSICSIEHFGQIDGAIDALTEMARVTKLNGYVYLTTECIINNCNDIHVEGISMFSPDTIDYIVSKVPNLTLVSPISYESSIKTLKCAVPMINNDGTYRDYLKPFHDISISHNGCIFTSIVMWFKKDTI